MSWRDAPVVQSSGSWKDAPVEGAETTPAQPAANDPYAMFRNTPAARGQVNPIDAPNVMDPVQGDPTPVSDVLDNVVGGYRPEMSVGEKIGTAFNSGGESLTLGVVGDEAAAAFDAALGRGSYDERLQFYRDNQEQFRDENPVLAFASEIAPALVPGMAGGKLLAALTTKLGRAGAGAALGALSGAVYGFAEGEGGRDERLANAGSTAALGALFGGAAPKVIDATLNIPNRVRNLLNRSMKRPEVGALKAAKNAAYRAVDEAGEVFSGDDMAQLHSTVKAAFDDGNYVAETDNALTATLRILERRSGQDTKLGQLDGIRQNLWKRYANAKDQPQILDAIKAIDDLIATRADASDLMQAARAANSRYAKLQLLEDAFQKAEDQTAGAGSGGNILNKYRQAVTNIINNEKKSRFFTQEEIAVMRGFVRGDFKENTLRRIGKLSPSGNGLMMALHVVGGMASSGATLPIMAVGAAAKARADSSAMRGAEAVKDMVSGFRAPPQRPQLTGPAAAAVTGAVPVLEDAASGLQNRLRLPR